MPALVSHIAGFQINSKHSGENICVGSGLCELLKENICSVHAWKPQSKSDISIQEEQNDKHIIVPWKSMSCNCLKLCCKCKLKQKVHKEAVQLHFCTPKDACKENGQGLIRGKDSPLLVPAVRWKCIFWMASFASGLNAGLFIPTMRAMWSHVGYLSLAHNRMAESRHEPGCSLPNPLLFPLHQAKELSRWILDVSSALEGTFKQDVRQHTLTIEHMYFATCPCVGKPWLILAFYWMAAQWTER